MPWIVSNVMYASGPYILLSVLSVPFAKMDRVVSAETTAFLEAALPTRNGVCYFNHRTLGDIPCFCHSRGHCPINVVEILIPYPGIRSIYMGSPADQNKTAT